MKAMLKVLGLDFWMQVKRYRNVVLSDIIAFWFLFSTQGLRGEQPEFLTTKYTEYTERDSDSGLTALRWPCGKPAAVCLTLFGSVYSVY